MNQTLKAEAYIAQYRAQNESAQKFYIQLKERKITVNSQILRNKWGEITHQPGTLAVYEDQSFIPDGSPVWQELQTLSPWGADANCHTIAHFISDYERGLYAANPSYEAMLHEVHGDSPVKGRMTIQFKQGGGSIVPEALREYGMEHTGGFQSRDPHLMAQATNIAWYELEVDARIRLPYSGFNGNYEVSEEMEIYLIGEKFVSHNGYPFSKEDVIRLARNEAHLKDPSRNGGSGWDVVDGPFPELLPYAEFSDGVTKPAHPVPAVKISTEENESCWIEDFLSSITR